MKQLLSKLKTKKFLIRLILTVFILICLPLILFQIAMMGQATGALTRINKEFALTAMGEHLENFYSRTGQITSAAISVMADRDIRQCARPAATGYDFYVAAKALRNYNKNLASSCTLGLYLRAGDRVISEGVSLSLDQYLEKMQVNCPAFGEAVAEIFRDSRKQKIISSIHFCPDSGRNYIIVSKPIPAANTVEEDAVIFYRISHEELEEVYSSGIPGCTGTAILDPDCGYILKDALFFELEQEEGFGDFLRQEGDTYISRQQDLMVLKYHLNSDSAMFLAAVKPDFGIPLGAYVKNIRNITLLSLLLIGILFVSTVYFNYSPVRTLVKKHSAPNNDHLSELELIDSVLFAADQKIITQQDMLEVNLLGDILNGIPTDPQTLSQIFPGDRFRHYLPIRIVSRPLSLADTVQLQNTVGEITGARIILTAGSVSDGDTVLLAMSRDSLDPDSLCESVSHQIKKITGETARLTAGPVVEKLSDLRDSYLKTLLDETVLMSIEGDGEISGEMSRLFQEFAENLVAFQEEEALEKLEQIRQYLRRFAGMKHYERYFLYKLLNVYLNAVRKFPGAHAEPQRLLGFTDTQDLFRRLQTSIREVCRNIRESEQSATIRMQQALLAYVDQNCCDHDICLGTASQYMEVSVYVVSRLFKETTGTGFKEYVTEKRLEKALELLQTTKLSVAAVADRVGFDNSAYFSTVFKAKFGITPSKARLKA